MIAGAPVPKLWDLLEAAFGDSDSKDGVEEDDPDTALLAKRPRLEPSSIVTPAVSPQPTMTGATALTTPPLVITLKESCSVLPVESMPMYDMGIPHELLSTCGVLTQRRVTYYCTQCTYRAHSRSTPCTYVHHDHMNVSIGCPIAPIKCCQGMCGNNIYTVPIQNVPGMQSFLPPP